MVEQYPHTATFTLKVAASQGAGGNWTPGSESSLQTECRLEANGQGKTITGVDGQAVEFAWTMYSPLMTTVIPAGTAVSVVMENETVKGTVKRQHIGQLNTRIWL